MQMGKDAELIYERLQKKAVSCHSTIKPLRRLSSVNSKSAKPPSNEPSVRLLKEGKIKLTDSGIERI